MGGRWDDEVQAMEIGAFVEMLHSRIKVCVDGAVLFRLYPESGLGSCPEGLLVRESSEGLSAQQRLAVELLAHGLPAERLGLFFCFCPLCDWVYVHIH